LAEAFATHAKRRTVTTEDVRLLTRNTPHLVGAMGELIFFIIMKTFSISCCVTV